MHRIAAAHWNMATALPLGFAATARMAVEEIEFDLHPTADGAIVVHHDATLDRTTDTRGVIAAMTLAEVKRARIIPRARRADAG